MVRVYKHALSQTLSAKIAAFIGGADSVSSAVEHRAEMMFQKAAKGSQSIDFSLFVRLLQDIGIDGNHEEEIEEFMISFDDVISPR